MFSVKNNLVVKQRGKAFFHEFIHSRTNRKTNKPCTSSYDKNTATTDLKNKL